MLANACGAVKRNRLDLRPAPAIAMRMANETKPEPVAAPASQRKGDDAREQRLAAALRANLLRRKVARRRDD